MTGRLTPRGRRAAVAGAALLMATSLGAVALQAGAEPATTSAAAPTTAAPVTTTTTSAFVPDPTTTTTVKPAELVIRALRTPQTPPTDAYADEPHVVVGTLEIPRLGLNVPLNQGISLTTIDRGPSHWPGTALPGETGNVVVAGHRVSKSKPFRDIDQLQPGDEVVMTGEHGRFVYRVTGSDVVTPDAMHIVDQTAEATATLFACHPPGSARYRYVVRLALEGVPMEPGGPPLLTEPAA